MHTVKIFRNSYIASVTNHPSVLPSPETPGSYCYRIKANSSQAVIESSVDINQAIQKPGVYQAMDL